MGYAAAVGVLMTEMHFENLARHTRRGREGAMQTDGARPRIALPRLDACSGRRLKTCRDPSRRMISKWLGRGVRSPFVLLAGTNSCVPDEWRVNQPWNESLRDPKAPCPTTYRRRSQSMPNSSNLAFKIAIYIVPHQRRMLNLAHASSMLELMGKKKGPLD